MPTARARSVLHVEHDAADDLALGSADCNVVADDDEFDLVRLLWMLGGILLLCETKIEDITSVVSA